jgi:hypothetical protein
VKSILPTSTSQQTSAPQTQTQTDTPSSPRWEDVPSELNSSFPSLSFPEDSNTHSQQPSGSSPPSQHHHHHHHHRAHETTEKSAAVSLAVFDSSLSTRTRIWALVGALSINLLLPFVNGVMLGFGEIFAKDIVMNWFGWNTSAVGLRTGGLSARRRRQKDD